ncbi:MAG: recombinase family protein [Sphingomonadaceae bacterium]
MGRLRPNWPAVSIRACRPTGSFCNRGRPRRSRQSGASTECLVQQRSESEIAEVLNGEGLRTDLGREWTRGTVHQILTNEKYIGNNVYNRISYKLKRRSASPIRPICGCDKLVPSSRSSSRISSTQPSALSRNARAASPTRNCSTACQNCLLTRDGSQASLSMSWRTCRRVRPSGTALAA